MYKVRVNNQTITITGGPNITTIDSTNVYQCEFIFDSSWNGLTCTACFKNSNLLEESQIILDDTYTCTIPQSVVSVSGNLYVGVLGTNAVNGNVVKPTVWERLAIVIQGVSPTGQIQEDNPTAIGQLISISNQALETANEALDKVNEFDPEVLDGLPTRVAKLETNAIRNSADIIELNNIKLDKSSIVQETGNSEELVMSQKAVTDALKNSNSIKIISSTSELDALLEELRNIKKSQKIYFIYDGGSILYPLYEHDPFGLVNGYSYIINCEYFESEDYVNVQLKDNNIYIVDSMFSPYPSYLRNKNIQTNEGIYYYAFVQDTWIDDIVPLFTQVRQMPYAQLITTMFPNKVYQYIGVSDEVFIFGKFYHAIINLEQESIWEEYNGQE